MRFPLLEPFPDDFDFEEYDRREWEFETAAEECAHYCFIEGVFVPRPFCPFHTINSDETVEEKTLRQDREDFEMHLMYVDNYRYGF